MVTGLQNWLHLKKQLFEETDFWMPVEIQQNLKMIQWFLGGRGQKWPWPSSWDPKICILIMNLGIEVIFLMFIVMQ